jgi:hypothetical protein
MIYRKQIVSILLILGVFVIAFPTFGALNLEGQSGIFLNSLAYPVANGNIEVSAHNVNLSGLGTVTSLSAAYGLGNGIDVGYTHYTSSVSGVSDQNNLLAKWQFEKETDSLPAFSVWVLDRDLSGGSNSFDFGANATKLLHLGNYPTVVDLGVRSTTALDLGLFGFNNDREVKFEGSFAVFVTKQFAIGAEFKQQIDADTWKDIAFRYIASDNLNIDAGIADLGPGLRRQIALGATWKN